MPGYKLKITVVFVYLILWTSTGFGAGDPFDPWKFNNQSVSTTTARSMAYSRVPQENIFVASKILINGLIFFSEYISRVDGDRCPMYPTCSSYSRQAIRKHGFFMGIIMTADRLIHEGNEMDYVPLVRAGECLRYYDPVHWNDYWWYNNKVALDK